MVNTIDLNAHGGRGGVGCLTAEDSTLPPVTDEPGKRATCSCGRPWVLQEQAGFVVWQPAWMASSVTQEVKR